MGNPLCGVLSDYLIDTCDNPPRREGIEESPKKDREPLCNETCLEKEDKGERNAPQAKEDIAIGDIPVQKITGKEIPYAIDSKEGAKGIRQSLLLDSILACPPQDKKDDT